MPRAVLAAFILLTLAGCGQTPGRRAATGGLMGAGAGAAIGSLSGWLMLLGMIARPRATSSRTNSGVTWSGMLAPQSSPSRTSCSFSAARPRFSRMATYSISGVMIPRRAYSSCVTQAPALARSTFGMFGKRGVSLSAPTLPLSTALTSRP